MKVIARKRNKPIFGDKVTWYFRDVHTLLSLYPEAKIINAVRDGRAVVSSMLHRSVPSEIPNNLIDMCLLWKRSILLAKTYRKTMPKTSYYEIKYENLVTYPKRELKRLCNFLGIAFERNMMSIEGSTNSAYKDIKTKGMDKTLLTKWKEKLDHTQIGLIEYIIRKELQNEGYKCLTSPNENPEFDKKLEIIIRSMIYRARRFKKEILNRMGFGAVGVPMLLRNLSRIYARSLASPRFFGRKQIRYIGH